MEDINQDRIAMLAEALMNMTRGQPKLILMELSWELLSSLCKGKIPSAYKNRIMSISLSI